MFRNVQPFPITFNNFTLSLDMLLAIEAMDSGRPKGNTVHAQLLQAAYDHDFERVSSMLNTDASLIEKKDPNTGRTVLHEVANCTGRCTQSREFFDQLIQKYPASTTLRDQEGFTPAELIVYPHVISKEAMSGAHRLDDDSQYHINRANLILARMQATGEAGHLLNQHMVLLHYVSEIPAFLAAHPEYDRIAFLLSRPNVLRATLPAHLTLLMYDRKSHTFVQLDSFGLSVILPEMGNMTYIVSPIERQVSSIGCREDATALGFRILSAFPDFFRFCRDHYKENPQALTELTQEQHDQRAHFNFKQMQGVMLSQDEKKLNVAFRQQLEVLDQLKVFKLENRPFHQVMHRLTDWPVQLVYFLERFDAVKSLRTFDQLGARTNHRYLMQLLEHGKKRTPQTKISSLQNLIQAFIDEDGQLIPRDLDAKFDIAGADFEKRATRWAAQRETVSIAFSRLFHQKLATLDNPRKPAKKQPIVDNMLAYAGLKCGF